MNKRKITKRSVQIVASCFGLFGLLSFYTGVEYAIILIRESDWIWLVFMPVLFFLFGMILVKIAWQNLRHFGPESIRHVVGLATFTVCAGIFGILRPFRESAMESKKLVLFSIIFLFPIVISCYLYKVVSGKIIEITNPESVEQDESKESQD